MQALLVIDVQNEFSPSGQRPIADHADAIARIGARVAEARAERRPIVWIRHHNKPEESKAFVPGSWGAELTEGMGPSTEFGPEVLFEKDVFGAFTGTPIEGWLRANGVDSVLVTGFYAHMCVSTTTREALMRGFDVALDPAATAACRLHDERLGTFTADELRRSALLQLVHMGATLAPAPVRGETLLATSA